MDAPKRIGRPTKFNAELGRRATDLARTGAPQVFIADVVGVHRDTLRDWVLRGSAELLAQERDVAEERLPEAGELRYPELADWVLVFRAARAEFALAQLAKITGEVAAEGSDAQFRRASWVLERLFPGEFGAHNTLRHTGADGEGPVEHKGDADAAVLGALTALARARDGGQSGGGSGGAPAGAPA